MAKLLLVNNLFSIESLLAEFTFLLIFITKVGCYHIHHDVLIYYFNNFHTELYPYKF